MYVDLLVLCAPVSFMCQLTVRICQVLCLDYLTCLEFYFEVLLNMLQYVKYYV
jgi:hypothetical protein